MNNCSSVSTIISHNSAFVNKKATEFPLLFAKFDSLDYKKGREPPFKGDSLTESYLLKQVNGKLLTKLEFFKSAVFLVTRDSLYGFGRNVCKHGGTNEHV